MAENILHFAGYRIRATGEGNLQGTLFSLDDINSSALADLALAPTNAREPTRLANFVTQRASLELKVTELGEYFRINRLIFFVKPLFSQFPG